MKIKFFGAMGRVTGSCFLLKGKKENLLVDFGMFQGSGNTKELNRKIPEIEVACLAGAILTHAHLDHSGRLPLLVQMGYKGKAYMTQGTRDLAELIFLDSVKIREEDRQKPLYTVEEVERLMRQIVTVEYGQGFETEEFKTLFLCAGHILGASSVVIEEKATSKKVVFSGDLGQAESPLTVKTVVPREAEVVVMEATYGNRLHEKRDSEKEVLAEEIRAVVESGGTLLIPAFSIQRSQRILHLLDHLQKERKIPMGLKVFLDSPMAIRATRVFAKYKKYYSKHLLEHVKRDKPFDFEGLVLTEKIWESKKIGKTKGTKVIIAGSGMMMGGRIMGHAKKYLPMSNTRLLITGYQGVRTLGRKILEGAKSVMIDEKEVMVNATVREISTMSAHADRDELLKWLKGIGNVRKVVLVHGEDEARERFGELVKNELKYEVVSPQVEEEIEI